MMFRRTASVSLALSVLFANGAWGQQETLTSAAQKAVQSNPEVLQKWHAYQAAQNEKEFAAGGYLPRVDLTAGRGHESRNDPLMNRSFDRTSASLTLNQMLYDGFATRNEVRRLDHARQVRYFELLDASETAALEAGRAYLDVLRYRKLVELAENNYVQHKALFDQVERKANAGVARKVDLEQATGRLALASANLLTETSNLHDVSARYQRIVGEVPPQLMPPLSAALAKGLPGKTVDFLPVVQTNNPAIQAAIENVRSASASSDARKAAYGPRFDLRLRNDRGLDLNGYTGNTDNRTAEVVMSWNLFNGMSDRARSRQYADQYNIARDIRDKTCRDVRQTALIAFNDTAKLIDQLVYLEQHTDSIGKARDAYRKQFEIGQRTLLDLLDTENEYFQSQRAAIAARHDLEIARVRTHAAQGRLLQALELTRVAKDEIPDPEQWKVNQDGAEGCPVESPAIYAIDKEALNVRAQELNRPVVAPVQPVEPVQPAAAVPSDQESQVMRSLRAWERAWAERDVIAYIRSYSQNFIQERKGNWVEDRKRIIGEATSIQLKLSDLKVKILDKETAVTAFKQAYQSPAYQDVVNKALEWRLIDGKWLITREISSQAVNP